MGQRALKGSTRDCLLFESLLLSKKSAETAVSIGVYLIDMVKTNTKIFCKSTIVGLRKDWPDGFYIELRINPMVPG